MCCLENGFAEDVEGWWLLFLALRVWQWLSIWPACLIVNLGIVSLTEEAHRD